MPCYENVDVNQVINKFCERFYVTKSENDYTKIINDMINQSYDNFWSNKYDYYQKITNGIIP
jgi:phosphatidylinositol kinase/protein kinase (PI-3  family)